MASLDSFDWDADAAGLADLLGPYYAQLLAGAYADADALLPGGVRFDLSNPAIQRVIGQLGQRVRAVSDTTRAELQGLVDQATAAGWSTEKLAQQIRALAEVDDGDTSRVLRRARTIARTETGTAYNLGSVLAYGDAGLTHVQVLDGDDDEPCRSANGARWTLEEAQANPLGHPNCTRAFAPSVE